jgi:mannose-6-phosphate isomerase-like protein (cupin superfamily)
MANSVPSLAAGGYVRAPVARDESEVSLMDKVNIRAKLDCFDEHWSPKVVGELNGQHVRLAKFKGEFVWHSHDEADELFMVIDGSFDMQYRDRVIRVEEGEFVIVPRGVEHCPRADEEVHVLLFEPADTLNTGETVSDRTVRELEIL